MTSHPARPALVSTMQTLSKTLAAGALLLAAAVLGGWAFQSGTLTGLPPMWSHMMPNSALCVTAAAVALWRQQDGGRAHGLAKMGAWSVAAVGLLTLCEYAFGWDLGIDRVLFSGAVSKLPITHPGRMSINSASCFAALGLALTRLDAETARGRRPAQLLVLIPAVIAFLALLGYAYGAQFLSGFEAHAKMALPTALSVVFLSFGVLFARPGRGLTAVLVSDSIGGRMARRFLPAAVVMLVGLGWLRIAGQHAGFYASEVGTALMICLNVVFFSTLIWRSAMSIDRTDAGRREAEEFLRTARDELEIRVQERTAELENQNREILLAAKALAASVGEIMNSTAQLAATAVETAATVAETTTTVDEVKRTSQISSQKAREVADAAQQTASIAQSGKAAVEQTIEGMGQIRQQMGAVAESILSFSEQSQAIAAIVATVDDLAAQSKLLAVNAAIEAANAGAEGQGFAVVAQEVRSLAEQSRQATRQVRGILQDIQKATTRAVRATEQGANAVEAGVRQSASSGDSIRALAESIASAAEASAQISAVSQQQFTGMDQVAAAMENIKVASTQTVASTRQAEQAAQQLHEIGQRLRQLVERFKT